MFFAQVSNEFYSEDPNVYKRERVPDPTGVGRPYMVLKMARFWNERHVLLVF